MAQKGQDAARDRWQRPEYRKRQTEGRARKWNDDEHRARILAAIRRGKEKEMADPERVAERRESARRGAKNRHAARQNGRFAAADGAPRRHTPKVRPCMSCRRNFLSQGPHNRMCVDCRHKSPSPFEPN